MGRMLHGLVVAAALWGGGAASAQVSTAVTQDHWRVAGIKAPAEIIVDHWGVAHIYAASARDAFFLQGYNAARDRLWQIDLWRKRGLGRLSASLGADYVEQDRAARLFLYRGDMDAEWAAYSPDAREIVEAWTAGVNAYVGEVREGGKPLPVEFRLTKSQPEDWAAEDVLRIRSHALVSNVTSEVARARVVCAGGIEADKLRRKLEPDHKTVVPRGLDPCDVPADVLKDYFLGTQAVSFEVLAGKKSAEVDAATQLADALDFASSQGSNNWVVAPSRTETGRAIMANDPHRALGAPSLRYIVGVNAPGLSIIGAGEPALPGVSLGHNGKIAFGLTIFATDQEDLYVYETRAGQPNQYRYRGRWEDMRVVRETIEVKGGEAHEVELRFTRHGPVVHATPDNRRAFAMRSVWNEPGLSGYFQSSRILRAASWDQFRDASNNWGAPPLNLVYADDAGNIGWSASARTPVRKNWDGLMPVPGDGRYEWDGFLGPDLLPWLHNPEQGWFGNANEMNLPADYPNEQRKISFEWSDPSRAIRVKEVLAGNAKMSIGDAMALQVDAVSPQARRATAMLKGLVSVDPHVSQALGLLTAWDGNETTDSVAAAIYETWALKHLGRAAVARVTPEAARELVGSGSVDAVISYLENPGRELGSDPVAARDGLMLESLSAAVAELKRTLGDDMETWTWGRLHHALFEPAVAVLADPQLRAQMTVGPLQVPGSASTPRAQAYRSSDFQVVSGASVRLVIDVGDWDGSMMINSPGQSADPYSAHYRDLFPLWAEGRYAPLLFTRNAVETNASRVIRLSPAS